MNANYESKKARREFLRAASAAAAGIALGILPQTVRAASGSEGSLKIGVIGSGRIGGTLGELWLKAGHEVMFSSLDLEKDKALAARLGGKASAGTSKEAAAFGEVILIAVPYPALPGIGRDLANLFKGKVLIDVSNPIPSRDGEIAVKAREKGAGAASAEYLPGARIVRAFNGIGSTRLPELAKRQSDRVGMPIAGDDANALAVASRLARDIGLEPVVIGPLTMGKYLLPQPPLGGEHTPDEIRQIVATLK
jgi:8-hydroxy-5-deazaflavin:NADPH oxidoreductase